MMYFEFSFQMEIFWLHNVSIVLEINVALLFTTVDVRKSFTFLYKSIQLPLLIYQLFVCLNHIRMQRSNKLNFSILRLAVLMLVSSSAQGNFFNGESFEPNDISNGMTGWILLQSQLYKLQKLDRSACRASSCRWVKVLCEKRKLNSFSDTKENCC